MGHLVDAITSQPQRGSLVHAQNYLLCVHIAITRWLHLDYGQYSVLCELETASALSLRVHAELIGAHHWRFVSVGTSTVLCILHGARSTSHVRLHHAKGLDYGHCARAVPSNDCSEQYEHWSTWNY